ncbi:Peptidase inhibitor I9 [Arthrobacter alpinus]|uniref:Peptidase inhibitor I9 n=1 Tax=Arthrobacter alpinus TaxID=656366 RepID=A0A1H5NKI6_9MICC|nr:S8 family serine peptidase [Arthrobacter alpinus]SEF01980.1 Peptidase inhibitor I9 [Arthrobacter alpinus]
MKRTGRTLFRSPGLRKAVALCAGLPLLLATVGALPASANQSQQTVPGISHAAVDPLNYQAGRYIVILAEQPIAMYNGGTAGLAATKPQSGQKLDSSRPEVKQYKAHLENKQAAVAMTKNVKVKRTYTAALNGFSADLSADQALALAKDPSVLAVERDTENAPDYSSTDFLGLSGQNGSWNSKFGGQDNAGKGVVVGIIDTGYTPSSPFFAGDEVQPLTGDPQVGVPYRTDDGNIAMLKANGDTFSGECQKGVETGVDFDGTACNSKVLSAHYFADDFLNYVAPGDRAPEEVLSPVDVASHGTHTGSTAAGNANVAAKIGDRNMGITSGVAPAAKLSVYKICWEDTDPDTGGCYSSSAVAAINQAILDGVDVLNYSISGSTTSTTDPVSLAFLSATSAGIFVAASAGNSGPTASTVNHGAPWLTTVAATSFSSELQGTAEFSDGTKFRGASMMGQTVPASHVILAVAAAAAGASNPELCGPNTLDAAKVAGKVVVCDRGVIDRTAKSAEVKRAGGVGMILTNVTPSSEDVDLHAVPTVHVNPPATQIIKDKVTANPDILVSLVDTDTTGLPVSPQPQVAGFSSRGPLSATNSDLLKPDVAAPGVAVLAGVSPIASGGDQFGMMSGTSMAAPHVAGFGALLKAKNPTWSPAAVKSAMMTTATNVVNEDGSKNSDLFATGAGQTSVVNALTPGLVYDAGDTEYLKFIQGTGIDLGMPGLGSTAARDMNVASFAVGSLAGKVTVTRTVTALTPGMYRATANVPGVNVKVTPSVLNFSQAGEQRTFKVTFENANAALGAFAMGSLTWQGSGATVTSPVAVRPLAALVQPEITFSSNNGNSSGKIPVVSGTNAPVALTLNGLSKADSSAVELVPGPLVVGSNASNFLKEVVVPAGTELAKFQVISADPGADYDMIVFNPQGQYSDVRTASSSETLSLTNPAPGTYTVLANLYSSASGGAVKATVDAAILGANAGNASVAPNPLKLANGKTGNVTLSWQGLSPGNYLGRVSFGDAGTATFVSVIITPGGTAVVPDENGNGNGKDKPKKGKKQESAFPTEEAPSDLFR